MHDVHGRTDANGVKRATDSVEDALAGAEGDGNDVQPQLIARLERQILIEGGRD